MAGLCHSSVWPESVFYRLYVTVSGQECTDSASSRDNHEQRGRGQFTVSHSVFARPLSHVNPPAAHWHVPRSLSQPQSPSAAKPRLEQFIRTLLRTSYPAGEYKLSSNLEECGLGALTVATFIPSAIVVATQTYTFLFQDLARWRSVLHPVLHCTTTFLLSGNYSHRGPLTFPFSATF
jgi:hypothetical protein